MPYWAEWHKEKGSPDQNTTDDEAQQSPQQNERNGYVHSISADIAGSRRLSHYVQHGDAYPYIHDIVTPKYMDTFEEPYAVFVFKYASDGELQSIRLIRHQTPLTRGSNVSKTRHCSPRTTKPSGRSTRAAGHGRRR